MKWQLLKSQTHRCRADKHVSYRGPKINTKDYLTKSNLPASDYVINPYVGCTHACKYRYARFMKRFTGHREEWGKFIDIKQCEKPINLKRLKGKSEP